MCWALCRYGLSVQPGTCYSPRFVAETPTLPYPLSLIVRFKVNLKGSAMVQLVENQNAYLRCVEPLIS